MNQFVDLLRDAEARLGNSESPRLDAELLLGYAINRDSTWLRTWPEKKASESQQIKFESLLKRRESGEPVAYILGTRGFWTLDLLCDGSTLIPRPDTETLVEAALDLDLFDTASVIDLGTGTGAIALALASEKPKWQVLAVDQSDNAIQLAQRNAKRNSISSVSFAVSNWFESIAPDIKFHLIVSNPPYIDPLDTHLQQGDVRFEPRSALVAGEQGYQDLFHIIESSRARLAKNGWLMLEHGYDQSETVAEQFNRAGYRDIQQKRDLSGHIRVTGGTI